ncbi:MAG TPA: hypothetical protein VGR50_04010 [Terriglobales bacterium]|nr:hypothetical protein [Terriglobales bacterium]
MRVSSCVLMLSLCAVSCGRSSPPQRSAAQAPAAKPMSAASESAQVLAKVPDFEFEPLTQQNVDMYLAVMREAVERRKRLPAADLAVLAAEKDFYAHLKTGWNPDPTPAQQAMMKRADELHHLDDQVAKEKGEFALYAAAREAIEGMVGPMKCGDSDCGQGMPEDDPKLRSQQMIDDAKRKAIIREDLVFLKPYVGEINTLVRQLR